jgi:hypothetical protein
MQAIQSEAESHSSPWKRYPHTYTINKLCWSRLLGSKRQNTNANLERFTDCRNLKVRSAGKQDFVCRGVKSRN